jgi:hypothetical protein
MATDLRPSEVSLGDTKVTVAQSELAEQISAEPIPLIIYEWIASEERRGK